MRYFLILFAVAGLHAGLIPIDIASEANAAWNGFPAVAGDPRAMLVGANFPTGAWSSGLLRFLTPSGPNNVWSADAAAGGQIDQGMESVTIPINLAGVSAVYTVINTEWGQPGVVNGGLCTGNYYASLTFTGVSSGSWTYNLCGGSDIRDYNSADWVNQAAGSINVWANGGQRLDAQAITLPAGFAADTLLSVTLNDWGDRVNVGNPADNLDSQRTFLAAVTVAQGASEIPEPGSVTLLAGSLAALAVWRRKVINFR